LSTASKNTRETRPFYTFARLLRDPFLTINTRLHEQLDQLGFDDIRPAHGTVMQHLALDQGTRLTDIATRAQLTKQTVGYLVDDLEALGYVERVPDPDDARARLVRYTARGREARKNAGEAIKRIVSRWEAALGKRKMAQLRTLLEELRDVIEAEEQSAGT
jgi:DNA-binding MarR family transcriptional regulator